MSLQRVVLKAVSRSTTRLKRLRARQHATVMNDAKVARSVCVAWFPDPRRQRYERHTNTHGVATQTADCSTTRSSRARRMGGRGR